VTARMLTKPTCITLCFASVAILQAARPADLIAVPYLGREEPYFFGSGVAGAGGNTNGKWDFLIGPDYTSPNFITEETLALVVDGKPIPLSIKLHRARETGVFFGTQKIGDLQVTIVDYAVPESPWVARLVNCINRSKTQGFNVSVSTEITPANFDSRAEGGNLLSIKAATGVYCFGNETKNWADRFSTIGFTEASTIAAFGKSFRLSTLEHHLEPGHQFSSGLYHFQHYDEGKPATFYGALIARRHPEEDLAKSVSAWKRWVNNGSIALPSVTESRAHDAVEASLIACKMQQNRDGGTIAGARKYANSYVRDIHGAVRLFLATGHFAEAKLAIQTINHKWSVGGFIPNYWSMGSDSFLGHSFGVEASEITGYYMLMIRGYLEATKDRAFVASLEKSMRFAIDAQLDTMEKNSWRIGFNGDETEQYCVRIDGQEYGGFPAFSDWHSDSWSFPSAAIAVASTQFYIDYLRSKGKSELASTYAAKLQKVRDGIDSTFWRTDIPIPHHHWSRLKDGSWPSVTIPNYGLLPVWVDAKLNGGRQVPDALSMKNVVSRPSGFLPTAPPAVMGFCGHNLAYLLYDMSVLHDNSAKDVLRTIIDSNLFGCWGTVSEFYGPNGTPNGHNFRVFESGITGEAILKYYTLLNDMH